MPIHTVIIEYYDGSAWQDITSVTRAETITYSRGRADRLSTTSPGSCTLTLDNADQQFNPASPYWNGTFGRGTKVRVSVQENSLVWPRFTGEVSEITPSWNTPATVHDVEVVLSGVLRRLSQGQPVIKSAIEDWVLSQSGLGAWYPLDSESGASYERNVGRNGEIFQGITGSGGALPVWQFGYTGLKDLAPQAPGAWLDLNATGSGTGVPYLRAGVNSSNRNAAVDMLFQSNNLGEFTIEITDGGGASAKAVRLIMNDSSGSGKMYSEFEDLGVNITQTDNSGSKVAGLLDDNVHHLRVELDVISGFTYMYVFLDGQVAYVISASAILFSGFTLDRIQQVDFKYSRYAPASQGAQSHVFLSSLAVFTAPVYTSLPLLDDAYAAYTGHQGEEAVERMQRIATDSGWDISVNWSENRTTPMGVQYNESWLASLQDIERTDHGILYEAADGTGLVYSAGEWLYVGAALTIDYTDEYLSNVGLTYDDAGLVNNLTLQRRMGGEFSAEVDTGPLSVAEPPLGAGRYEQSATVNVDVEGQLEGHTRFLLNLGTDPAPRITALTVNMSSPALPLGSTRTWINAADVGMYLTLKGLGAAGIYRDLHFIILGITESVGPVERTITFLLAPGDVYDAPTYGDSAARYDTEGSSLASSATTTATSLSIASDGVLWSTTAEPYDLDIGGERVTVTAMTGTSSPQTATVVRSVNGVVKAHDAGAAVSLFTPKHYVMGAY